MTRAVRPRTVCLSKEALNVKGIRETKPRARKALVPEAAEKLSGQLPEGSGVG
jgi:hypothetical protein